MLSPIKGDKLQEVYDEALALKLVEHQTEGNKDVLYLTPIGFDRMQSRFYVREHSRAIGKFLNSVAVSITTLLLAMTALLQTCKSKESNYVDKLQNIHKDLQDINESIKQTQSKGSSLSQDSVH